MSRVNGYCVMNDIACRVGYWTVSWIGVKFHMNRCLCLLIVLMLVSGKKLMNAEEKNKLPIIIAHRGASVTAPENTLASIKAAIEVEADWVEWDTRVTADGVLILQHDETLEKYLGKKGRVQVAGMTFEAAQSYDVGSWFGKRFAGEKMPSLDEAIEASLPDMMPLIERKTGSAEQHLAVIRKLKVENKVAVQAFDWKFLRELRKLAPELKLGALGEKKISDKKLLDIVSMNVNFIGWRAKDLKRGDVDRLHVNGIKVAVWTVDNPGEIRKFVSWGVDAIITNNPARTRKVVEGN